MTLAMYCPNIHVQFLLKTETLLYAPWYFILIRCKYVRTFRYTSRFSNTDPVVSVYSCSLLSTSVSDSFPSNFFRLTPTSRVSISLNSRDHVREAGLNTNTSEVMTLSRLGGLTTVSQGHGDSVTSNNLDSGKLLAYPSASAIDDLSIHNNKIGERSNIV